MKKSYIKLIIMMLGTYLLLLGNCFSFKVGNRLALSLLLCLFLFMIKLLVGFEKPRYRYVKQLFFITTIFLLIFFLCYYILGFIVGFYQVGNYYSLHSFIEIILPIIIYTIIKEITRYYLVCKLSENRPLLIMGCILFMFFDITIVLSTNTITNFLTLFVVIAHSILPIITQNILCTYVARYYGYKTNIYYMLVMLLFRYFIPIIPNPNEFIYSVIFFLTPLILLGKIIKFTKQTKVEKLNSNINARQFVYYLPAIIVVMVSVYLVSGYFRYYSIAIASGSMSPSIKKGSVVIVDRTLDIEDIEENMIIAFKYEKRIIVHRVVDILTDGNERYIYTKGDANSSLDNYRITEDMLIGLVKLKIPGIGYPTIWLNEMMS